MHEAPAETTDWLVSHHWENEPSLAYSPNHPEQSTTILTPGKSEHQLHFPQFCLQYSIVSAIEE